MAKRKKRGRKRRVQVRVGTPRIEGRDRVSVGAPQIESSKDWPEPSEEEMLASDTFDPDESSANWPEPSEGEVLGTEVFDPEAAAAFAQEPDPRTFADVINAQHRQRYPVDTARGLANVPQTSGRLSGYEYVRKLNELRRRFPEAFQRFGRSAYPPNEPTGLMTRGSADLYRNYAKNAPLLEGYGVQPPQMRGAPEPEITPSDRAALMSQIRVKRRAP
jgi:hypothetical protein